MEDIKYIDLIEIGPVIIEIQGVENGELVVPVDNTLVCHTAFLAADTWPCILISYAEIMWNFLLEIVEQWKLFHIKFCIV